MSWTSSDPSRRLREPSTGDPACAEPSIFIPSPDAPSAPPRRWLWFALGFLAVIAIGAAGLLVAWPRLSPRRSDQVERVAENYLRALANQDGEAARRLAAVEEPPAILSVRGVRRDRARDRRNKGSFAPLADLHTRIEQDYVYDEGAGRFTPKNALGAAAETMDALEAAKENAEKSGLYKKMQSGDPNDLFDAAEQFGKVFTDLAEGILAPKRILPTYQMLVESAKPALPEAAKELALAIAASSKTWDTILKRPFHSLKADGPFIYDEAEITAEVTDRLASLGDPPSRIRLRLVRFQLEGIDTGWRVVSARRISAGGQDRLGKTGRTVIPSQPGSQSPGEPNSPGSGSDPDGSH
jgi:hypothetical protein